MDADHTAAAGRERRDAADPREGAGARHPAEANLRGDAVGAREDPVDGGARVEAAEPEHVLGPERLLLRPGAGGDAARAVARVERERPASRRASTKRLALPLLPLFSMAGCTAV